MILKNGEIVNVPSPNLERPQQSQETSSATEIASNSNPTEVPALVNDQVALSLATKFLQQTAIAGEGVRLERILQLKTVIVKEQYRYDPLVVGRALIEAHLRGE